MIATTSTSAMSSVRKMSRMPSRIEVVVSTILAAATPSGKRSPSSPIALRTEAPTCMALLPGSW